LLVEHERSLPASNGPSGGALARVRDAEPAPVGAALVLPPPLDAGVSVASVFDDIAFDG
jgi:hypothetical protein